jgi:phage gp46-like protein
MTEIFQGDPRLFLIENGSKLIFKAGQPIMDKGLENFVLISLFTRLGWFGNSIVRERYQIGSEFEEALNAPITIDSFGRIQIAAEKALNHSSIGKIIVNVNNPINFRLDVRIRIEPPGQPAEDFLLTKDGLNWFFQKTEPANLKK